MRFSGSILQRCCEFPANSINAPLFSHRQTHRHKYTYTKESILARHSNTEFRMQEHRFFPGLVFFYAFKLHSNLKQWMKRNTAKHKPKLNYEFLEHRLSTAFVVLPAEKISYETTASAFFFFFFAKSIWQDPEDHLERVSITEEQFWSFTSWRIDKTYSRLLLQRL